MYTPSRRVQKDYATVSAYSAQNETILMKPKPSSIMEADVLVIGQSGPYLHGFFHFHTKFPEDYPFNPPIYKYLTTGGGSIRMNPNLYADGKVCLSVINTWGSEFNWAPTMTQLSVLLSIQSMILNDNPLYNEPGWQSRSTSESQEYNEMLLHHTLRVAVCGMVEHGPPCFLDHIRSYFVKHFDYYVDICEKHRALDGQPMRDPYGSSGSSRFNFSQILSELNRVRRLCE
ncbi:hypothetical protein RCL1_004966 [Eukaryota sp. TZLM3-RCL]